MYVVRRVWKVKPGTPRRVATLLAKVGEAYKEAGQRGDARIYFNGSTCPGEINHVYMEWTAESLESPYRGSNEIPESVRQWAGEVRQLAEEESRIEFYELLTPDKYEE